jgi:glycosyltransferase involved in cell wall biosynthesis
MEVDGHVRRPSPGARIEAVGPMSVGVRSPVPVSAVVMTKNEEHNIEQCLASLTGFDEVFVVDSESTDRTRELAERCGARVVAFSWNGEYPKKKQWSLENLPFSHEWVFYADADEVVTPRLAAELGRLFDDDPAHKGYFVSYDYVFLGRVLRYGWRPRKLVLLDRRVSRFLDVDDLEVDNFWEVEGHYQPEVRGSVGCLENRMVHNDHDTLYQYFDRHNRYSDWEAHINVRKVASDSREATHGLRSALKRVLGRARFRGLLFFIYCYWVRGGFLDGRAGLNYALSKSFYYWQIALKERELLKVRSAQPDAAKSAASIREVKTSNE